MKTLRLSICKIHNDTVSLNCLQCKIDKLEAQLAEAHRLLAIPPNVCPSCGMFLGLLHRDACPNCRLLAEAHAKAQALDRLEELASCGWFLVIADLLIKDRCSLMFKRDAAGTAWWHSLDDEGKEREDLYCLYEGKTFAEAVTEAFERSKP